MRECGDGFSESLSGKYQRPVDGRLGGRAATIDRNGAPRSLDPHTSFIGTNGTIPNVLCGAVLVRRTPSALLRARLHTNS